MAAASVKESAERRRYLSPLRYPGGKARMAAFLADVWDSLLSPMDVEVWVEPFAGGGGAGLALLDAGFVAEIWLTEKNSAIAALWRAMVTQPGELAARVEAATVDMGLWAWARDVLAHPAGAGDIELGMAALVVNRCSRSGIVTPSAGPIGGKHQTGRWHVASRWNGPSLADRVRHVGRLGPSIRVDEGDAIDRIAALAGSGIEDEVFVFVDPPYMREGNRLYAHGMAPADHQRLAGVLNENPARWMLTYDNEPTVLELYPDRQVVAYEIPNSANRARLAIEYAVFSDDVPLPADPVLLPRSVCTVLGRARRGHGRDVPANLLGGAA